MKKRGSVLFLGKEDDTHTAKAAQFCRANFTDFSVHMGRWGDPMPAALDSDRWECVISYLSRWIVPQRVLKNVRFAINFHPGPPEYPGYGCNNFALYEGATSYGVSCHHMAAQVDTGAIIAVKRFPVFDSDNGATLLQRAYDYQLVLFYEVITCVLLDQDLPASAERWTRKPFTRSDFDRLGQITPDMDPEEVARRRRATDMDLQKPASETERR